MYEQDENDLKEWNSVVRDNLFYYMKSKGISTLNRLSVLAGVDKNTVNSIVKPYSTANPTSLTIIRLERVLGIEKGELFKERK